MVDQFREMLLTHLDGLSRLNSTGTLALHLIGNMNHFIGATLGGTRFIRDRNSEFSLRDVPRHVLLSNIAEVRETVNATMSILSTHILESQYPLTTFGENKPTADVLIILCSHAAYHLGQVNYLRRLMDRGTHG